MKVDIEILIRKLEIAMETADEEYKALKEKIAYQNGYRNALILLVSRIKEGYFDKE